jgi:hypothetical protein
MLIREASVLLARLELSGPAHRSSRRRGPRAARDASRDYRRGLAFDFRIQLGGEDCRWLGPPAGHQTAVRRAQCCRRTAAQPNNVAVKIRPAFRFLVSRPARDAALRRWRLAAGDDGDSRIASAVSLTASI